VMSEGGVSVDSQLHDNQIELSIRFVTDSSTSSDQDASLSVGLQIVPEVIEVPTKFLSLGHSVDTSVVPTSDIKQQGDNLLPEDLNMTSSDPEDQSEPNTRASDVP
ncbi:MAG: hypothetical protein AAGH92_07630, partial [Planctomycetota bacterium]